MARKIKKYVLVGRYFTNDTFIYINDNNENKILD